MSDPIYCIDNGYEISPRMLTYRYIVEHFILPNFDDHTTMTVFVSSDPSEEVEFAKIESELFTIIDSNDQAFIKNYMENKGMIPKDDSWFSNMESFRWTIKDLSDLICGDNVPVIISKNKYYTRLQLIESDIADADPEFDKPIGYLGEMPQFFYIDNPLDLLPISEPRELGESFADYFMRGVMNAEFWRKRREVWNRYVRLHNIDETVVYMTPELFEPIVIPNNA